MRSTLIAISAATLFLALSGFDCASTEMTTAKVAIQQKDYDRAELNLKKEVAARPQNGAAWSMLADLYEARRQYPEMLDAQTKALAATTPALSAPEKANIYAKRYNLWVTNYEGARKTYVKASNDGDNAGMQKALEQLDMASTLRPDYNDNIYLRAAIYHDMKDQEREAKTNKEYIEALRSDVEKGSAAGLALGMKPSQVAAKLGKPSNQMIDAEGGFYQYAANDLYVYFDAPQDADTPVVGWKYFQGSTTPEKLKEATWFIRSAPYYTLGIDAFYAAQELDKGDKTPAADKTRMMSLYDEALRYLKQVQKLDLSQDRAGQVIADIYGRTNRTAEAKAAFEENIRQNPNDPSAYINYGSMLVNMKDYAGAIDNFKKVLGVAKETEDKYQTALFNLGAVYKNWGADLQKAAGTKPTPKQQEEYMGKLRESANYFEQYRKLHGNADFDVLAELANLYVVLGKEKESAARGILTELEALKSTHERDADYWDAMSSVYLNIGEVAKAEQAAKKADSLR